MDYGDSVQKVLLRKIRKAEQDLTQLKLDYCRFVFGLTHRARVVSGGTTYTVRSVDVESMENTEEGGFSKPVIEGAPADQPDQAESVALGTDWALESASSPAVK
ncbi:hypothetical protein BKP64_05510 [Marinobacter salinus]|uniref:Uncharacterized protein n=1 Tax=Marinobacter salinus TaxID=1874317 RepID=A0A1D9GJC2_9GAMM|nr:hypothetical protein [Marinobacter salinus]AOY87671.1 hypothetical protein BKP64_05510 [Marinobacter salinus]